MAGYSVSFSKDSTISNLYQALKKDGVKDADLDAGYPETDYVHKKRIRIKAGDHVLQEQEVLNYALERYEKYQKVIQETTGYVVPWTFDDLDPNTKSDELLRQRATRAIQAFGDILTSKGLSAETERHQELLALSLYAFAMSGKQSIVSKAALPDDVRAELAQEGLEKVTEYLERNGGLNVAAMDKDCEVEATALEALEKGCGWCSEQSSILYPLFKMAGLKASFVHGEPKHDGALAKNFRESQKVNEVPGHVSVSLFLDKRIRYFDAALKQSNAALLYDKNFQWWFDWSMSECLSGYYYNLGNAYTKKGELDEALQAYKKAIEINPKSAEAYYNLGNAYTKKGELDEAIQAHKKAIEINPKKAEAYSNLGNAYGKKEEWDAAIQAHKKAIEMNPKLSEFVIASERGLDVSQQSSYVKLKITGLGGGEAKTPREALPKTGELNRAQ